MPTILGGSVTMKRSYCILTTGLSGLLSSSYTVRGLSTVASPLSQTGPPRSEIDGLHSIASTSVPKIPGSLSYLRTWRRWSESALDVIRSDLLSSLPNPVDEEALQDLSFRLGEAADQGVMPSFSNTGALAGYAVNYFCRAQLLADLLFEQNEPQFLVLAMNNMLLHTRSTLRTPYRIVSLGGGPGFDFVGLALMCSFSAQHRQLPSATISAKILDYEQGWSPFVDSMSQSVDNVLGGQHSCSFDGCDITLPLSDASNAACAKELSNCDLWVCSYCVAENALRLRENDFVFFRNLFRESKEGALFVFTETTHRLWSEMVDVALATTDFEVAFPRRNGRGKKGRQLILKKKRGAALGTEEQLQRKYFVQDNCCQERKTGRGIQRMKKKVPGAK